MVLKLIAETPRLEDFRYVFEESNKDAPRTLFITGPYMMAEGVNRNKRLYPIDELRREVQCYTENFIRNKRAMGELNHPASAEVDLGRACHLVTELREDNNVFVGKSRVLSTPCGQLVRSLIQDGVQIGMSSRALGRLEESAGHNVVRDLKLVAIDCVADPSYSDAWVSGILESKQWVLKENGKLEEMYDSYEKSLVNIPRHEKEKYLTEQIIKFIKSIRG